MLWKMMHERVKIQKKHKQVYAEVYASSRFKFEFEIVQFPRLVKLFLQ